MLSAGVEVFARELPDAEETMRNAETEAIVREIFMAMSAQIEGRAELV